MHIPLLRTLSGRIILGFAVLILTFGTISALIVFNMELLGRQIRLIRTGYLPLALETKNLDEKQDILWSYISDELPGESLPTRAERRLVRHMQARSRSLRDTEKVLSGLSNVPDSHSQRIAETRRQVSALHDDIAALAEPYERILATPPIDAMASAPNQTPGQIVRYQEARRTLETLRASESEIRARIKFLARQQSDQARQTALTLERNEQRLRLFAISMGLAAVLIGMLITAWAILTLRPLKRLRDGSRHIAEGEYQSRIDETGPAEVADLAREFNVMARAIEERERELVRSERLAAVGKMAALIAHEVRNPLSSIGLNTELLTEIIESDELPGSSDGEAHALCQAITTEVDRLTAITEDYLQFARLPKPKLQIDHVNPIAGNLADFERERMSLRGVTMRIELAPDLPAVLVDEAQMRQALLNLLRNAADAVESVGGGEVVLRTRHIAGPDGDHDAEQQVEIAIADTGPGIPEDVLPKLFEPFFSTKQGGTGLGLALTHQIIREHGGQLRVDSRPGKGATFIIVLPAGLTAGLPAGHAGEAAATPPPTPPHVSA